MADFNSRYTGAEIETAIAKTEKIKGYREVWAGTPTNQGIPLANLPINPDTGDRTGVYDVILSRTSSAPGSGEYFFVSRLYILNEGDKCAGTSHSYVDATRLIIQAAAYNSQGNAEIIGNESRRYWPDTSGSDPMYIHQIYRIESVS